MLLPRHGSDSRSGKRGFIQRPEPWDEEVLNAILLKYAGILVPIGDTDTGPQSIKVFMLSSPLSRLLD